MSQSGVLKVLIAEDRAALRKLIRSIVGGLVGEIRECPAEDLAATYLGWRPDFVLLDADMTAVDSIAAIRWIQAVDCSARVILLSSYDSPEMQERAQLAGAFGYVRKENLLELSRLVTMPR
ncbi:MAG TPA: response regulator [Bryobacteraceae bacterium]|jgi:two-component system NarL family response regulator